jgi:TrfA protein
MTTTNIATSQCSSTPRSAGSACNPDGDDGCYDDWGVEDFINVQVAKPSASVDGKHERGHTADLPAYESPQRAAIQTIPKQIGKRFGENPISDSTDIPKPNPTTSHIATKGAAPSIQPLPFPHSGKLGYFPAFMSRSALFRCGHARIGHSSKAAMMAEIDIPIAGEITLRYCGPRLGMSDKLVYQAIVDIAKAGFHDINTPLRTSLRTIALALGWKNLSGGSLNWVADSIIRLCDAHVSITSATPMRCSGYLLKSMAADAAGIEIEFDAAFISVAFTQDQLFKSNASRTASLQSSLARWLHDYLATHTKRAEIDMKYLRTLCGYEASKGKFPSSLREALKELAETAPMIMQSYELLSGTKDSDTWKLKPALATEKPQYIMPAGYKAAASRVTGRTIKSYATKPPRGGVVL